MVALAAFPAAIAMPALEVARRDSSAQVRAAAIRSLIRFGGQPALAAAREAWTDSSYGVQAAAIGSLIARDTANRASWIARGLAASSYRDVVRDAALNVVARLGNPAYTASVDSLRGETPNAANTLAFLSARGDTTALAALVRALDDPRPYVRDWTLRAIGRLPADLRDPPLTAVVASLRNEKTKAAVDALLHQTMVPAAH